MTGGTLTAPAEVALPSTRRERTPTVLQMEAAECGAASLRMVLAHYGRWVPLDELRQESGVSRDGVKASNIVKAARSYGMVAKGFSQDIDALRAGPLPAIVYWNFNHFLVVEGYAPGRWFLKDPAYGSRAVSDAEFDRSFTGIVLRLEPGADFRREGRPPSVLTGLAGRMRNSLSGLLYAVLAGLGLVIPGLAAAVLTKAFVDQVLVADQPGAIWPILGLLAGAALIVLLLTALRSHYLLRLETKLSLHSSGVFLWHILRLPVSFYAQRSAGEIAGRVSRNDRVAVVLSSEVAAAVIDSVVVVFYFAVMVSYSPGLALVAVAAAVINILVLRKVGRRRRDENLRVLQDSGALLGSAMSGIRSIESVKAAGREADLFTRIAGLHAKTVSGAQRLGDASLPLFVVPPLMAGLTTVAVLGWGGLNVVNGAMSLGTLIAFQLLMGRAAEPIGRFVALGGTLQEVGGDLERLDDVLANPIDEIADAQANRVDDDAPVRLTGQLELRNVTFGYSPLEPPLLNGVSLILRPGSRVALVGGSGSGKSTITRLVAGLYHPWSGEILFDGIPRDDWPRDTITTSVALVDQNITLFSGTVRDNLTMWDPSIPEQRVVQAAHDASIHEQIARRPDGYLTEVRESGANFSGGEGQRLEIARALVPEPRIMILDEATSALDPTTEALIDRNIRRRGCTTLIVAHRLSTIRDCDEIVVMERGRIVERGTHDQMIGSGGPYSRLFAADGSEDE
ncbi:NHLM bacteriocin system ABC transporter, peptidase/ATP-binding protein [Microbacterium sp. cf046]|uniref:NHLP family bacteriocin export ABC transporter peptidase/permease/ATPase subunit n=1 Tax=Microbacterium sp. cf046 TaxID=1761803 RepID=UPI0008E1E6BE|nr:NHLP family bacteriocin export ABC transporter peptidase/permease/ATPase subunit [Microbacterium sp. cf046]SFS07413.1 NHLM bacteriocin system ABC transporter, peptidase/ATP-binding protein [Microbacterium sp. cf046]